MPSRLVWHELFGAQVRNQWVELLSQAAGIIAPDLPTIDALTPQVSPRVISGTAVPGSTIQIVINLVPHATVTTDQYGDWAYALNTAPGTYGIEVRQIVNGVPSAYTPQIVFVILADEPPPEHSGNHGRDDLDKPPDPPITAGPPGGGLLKRPFRRPPVWPTEKGY